MEVSVIPPIVSVRKTESTSRDVDSPTSRPSIVRKASWPLTPLEAMTNSGLNGSHPSIPIVTAQTSPFGIIVLDTDRSTNAGRFGIHVLRWKPSEIPFGAELRTTPWTHSGSSIESAPMLDSTTRSKIESASSPRENEKFPSPVLEPVEMSVVIPDRTPLTDLPRSENPPMKNATPVIPSEESSSGMSRDGPESEPVGISTERVDGSGSISASTFNGRESFDGAFPMLIRIAFLPSMVANAVPIPAFPEAPSSRGGIHPISLTPDIVDEREEVLLGGS